MAEKVVLILVDGMRPDSLAACKNKLCTEYLRESTVCMTARSVMPSVTLPCHMSLFHSVTPDRHGILTNQYTPQVRPVEGLFERLAAEGRTAGMVFNWNELRDLARPGSAAFSVFYSGHAFGYEKANRLVARDSLRILREEKPDFLFTYLGRVDEDGHAFGWMTEEYLRAVSDSWEIIREITDTAGSGYQVLVTADHGGHGRSHGFDCAEDMTIPLLLRGSAFPAGKVLKEASLLDIAPTVAALTGIQPAAEWEGRSLV